MADYFNGVPGGQPTAAQPYWWPNQQGSVTSNVATKQGGGDFGPLPPQNMPAGGYSNIGPAAAGPAGAAWQAVLDRARAGQTAAANNQYLDPSMRNSALDDAFSGVKDGWEWVAGRRMKPVEANSQATLADLYGFGYRTPETTAAAGGNWVQPKVTPSAGPINARGAPAPSGIPNANTGTTNQGQPVGARGTSANPNPTVPYTPPGTQPQMKVGMTKPGSVPPITSTPGTNSNTGTNTSNQPAPTNTQLSYNNGQYTYNGQPITNENAFGSVGNVNFGNGPSFREDGSLIYQPGQEAAIQAGWANPNGGLSDAFMRATNGMIPVGGSDRWNQIKDPSKVVYDPRFGLLTSPDNYNVASGGLADFLAQYGIPAATIAAIGLGGAGTFGFGPLAEGTGAASVGGAGASATLPEITAGNMATPALEAAGAGAPALAAAPAITVPGAATAAGLTLPTLSQIGQGIRTAGSALSLGRAVGAVGNSGQRGSPGSSGLAGTIGDVVAGAVGNAANNRNINAYNEVLRNLIERGDPYGPQRADAIRRLGLLESDPGSVTKNPLFSAMNDKSQMDLSRVLAARGYTNSGNELGALQENFLANMNKFYGDEWNRTAREAGVFIDPGTSVAAGLRGAGTTLEARNNRDAALSALLASALGGRGQQGSGSIWDALGRWFSGSNDGTEDNNNGTEDTNTNPEPWQEGEPGDATNGA